ncbi:MAG: hypothetical protein HON90_14700 [Halobacteriovoraceae bacterium]|jgi:hypothetical protein|nr:hypothetical protein [Halobacteriovoraceae bacterium]
MLGPIGSEIMSIFRLLSPNEIDRYIVPEEEVSQGMKIAAGAEDMDYTGAQKNTQDYKPAEKFPKDHQAKIIPLSDFNKKGTVKKKQANPQENESDNHSQKQRPTATPKQPRAQNSNSSLESIGVLSAQTIREQEHKRLNEENENKDSATIFLLKEREKMRGSKKRMIEQQAIRSYKTNSEQEFYTEAQEADFDEEDSSEGLKGILLNKKHF